MNEKRRTHHRSATALGRVYQDNWPWVILQRSTFHGPTEDQFREHIHFGPVVSPQM